MKASNIKFALLAELLRTLEAEGFAFGIDKHLQLQELLALLPEDLSPEALKQSLAPAIATNEQEQDYFYLLFDQAFARVAAIHKETELSKEEPRPQQDRWLMPIIALLGLLLLLVLFILRPPPDDTPDRLDKNFVVYHDSTYISCLNEAELQSIALPIQTAFLCADSNASELGRYHLTTDFCLAYIAGENIGIDSLCVRFVGNAADTLNVYFFPQIKQTPKEEVEEYTPIKLSNDTLFQAKNYPLPTDILSLQVPELSERQKFYKKHYRKLKGLSAVLLTLLAIFILLWRDRKRRELIAQQEARNMPPFIWNIETPQQAPLDLGTGFGNLLNSLRKRTESDHRVFDAKKTVSATIQQGGMVQFKYRRQTRPPEYLMLIDRESGDSHRTRFFDYLYQRFTENEVFVHRYFYDNDLRRSWNEEHTNGLSLKELGRFHPDARLIIIGNAYQLLSPLSGKLAKWAKVLEQWKDRALLSYIPSSKWGRRETQLGKELVVLPASVKSLHFLLDEWDQGEEAEFEKWCDVVDDVYAHPIEWQGDLISTLRQYYPPAMQRWIAACAVYPSLHWDTTLFLAEQLSTPEAPLLSLEKVQQLHRLDWFTQGEMPDEVRAELLEWLEQSEPDLLQQTRENLYQLLEQNPPPKESAAFEDYQLQRDLNEWLITADRSRKKELEQDISEQVEKGAEPDYTVLKYLDRAKTPLDFIVPKAWKKYVYNGGFRGLGMKQIQRDLLWMIPCWGLLVGLMYLWVPGFLNNCIGESLSFPTEQQVNTYVGMESTVYALAYSSNGRQIIAGGDDGIALIWDAKTGQVQDILEGHRGSIRTLAYSPKRNQILTGSTDKTAKLWDTKGTLLHSFEGHTSAVTDVAFSPEGNFIATASNDNTILLWDAATRSISDTLAKHTDTVTAIAFSPDGKYLVSSSEDGQVLLWILSGGTAEAIVKRNAPIQTLAYAPNGKEVLFSIRDSVVLLNLFGEQAQGYFLGATDNIIKLTLSPDGQRVAAGTSNGMVYIWDKATAELQNSFEAYEYNVKSLAFSPDNEFLATAGENKAISWQLDIECCIKNPADRILYNEHLARLAIEQKQFSKEDSISGATAGLLSSERYPRPLSQAYEVYKKNLSVDYWNDGVLFYLASRQYIGSNDSLYNLERDSACFYFDRAYALDSVAARSAKKWCEEGDFYADFIVEPETCNAPCVIQFTDYSQGAVRRRWNFGDGQISEVLNPTHRYNRKGTYEVVLTVFNDKDSTMTTQQTVVIGAGIITRPPRTTKPAVSKSEEEVRSAADSTTVEIPEEPKDTLLSSQLDPNTQISFQWLSPENNSTTQEKVATLTIDVISNRSLQEGNFGLYHNNRLLAALKDRNISGNNNSPKQQIARRVYTYRQAVRLVEGRNEFYLAILDEKNYLIADSEKRVITLETQAIEQPRVFGKVTDSSGKAIQDVEVIVMYDSSDRKKSSTNRSNTNQAGEFNFEGLTPQKYNITFDTSLTLRFIKYGYEMQDKDIVLRRGGNEVNVSLKSSNLKRKY